LQSGAAVSTVFVGMYWLVTVVGNAPVVMPGFGPAAGLVAGSRPVWDS
jgi:hypothetical protein